ncbi:MAG: hypothetical protein QOF71_1442 [Candidatus Eremiobacteraeota bacterium]|jgi:hypothetical protein|nr:hypothetical protein [Candidatus Eremiobacteraeota bacterium]
MRLMTLYVAFAVAAGVTAFGTRPDVAKASGGQQPCVYELLSLDVSSEHALRLLRKCAPKSDYDALLVAALKRRQLLASPPPANPFDVAGTFAHWIGAGLRAVSWLAWPLAILSLAVVARAVIRPLARDVWRKDPPRSAIPGAEIAIARNLAQDVSTAKRRDAETHAAVLIENFANRPRDAFAAENPLPGVALSRHIAIPYFDTAAAAILPSQLRAMKQRLTNGDQLTLADIRTYYDRAVEQGAALGFRDWIDYLDRFGFITQGAAIGGAAMTSVAITPLGRLFVGWCDATGLSPQMLAGSGRPF